MYIPAAQLFGFGSTTVNRMVRNANANGNISMKM